MKEYKSNEELLYCLISKGVIVKNKKKTLEKFERYTYYSIINTYKEVFKVDDKYIDGVTFDEIFALYEFDKNLSAVFLKYALEIEMIIKSLIVNTIIGRYGVKNYLNKNCFDSTANINAIDDLLYHIEEDIKKNYNKHPAITHYKDKYDFIPPFVLVKIMTMGQISRYYGLLKQDDRQNVSKYFKLSDKMLKQILINLTLCRNNSAHNDRFFTFHSKFFISFNIVDKTYKTNDRSTNLYMLIRCMGLLLDDKKYKQFTKQVNTEIKKLEKKLKVISIENILNIMGFPNE